MYHTTTPADMQGRVLQDITPAGKVRPWASHKSDAQLLSYALALSDERAAQRVRHCADTLWFRRHISIHALLAESDQAVPAATPRAGHFYPRSPCGERLFLRFLSRKY